MTICFDRWKKLYIKHGREIYKPGTYRKKGEKFTFSFLPEQNSSVIDKSFGRKICYAFLQTDRNSPENNDELPLNRGEKKHARIDSQENTPVICPDYGIFTFLPFIKTKLY